MAGLKPQNNKCHKQQQTYEINIKTANKDPNRPGSLNPEPGFSKETALIVEQTLITKDIYIIFNFILNWVLDVINNQMNLHCKLKRKTIQF